MLFLQNQHFADINTVIVHFHCQNEYFMEFVSFNGVLHVCFIILLVPIFAEIYLTVKNISAHKLVTLQCIFITKNQ